MSDNSEDFHEVEGRGPFVEGLGYPWLNGCGCGHTWIEYSKKRPEPTEVCSECCEHSDTDEYCCLDCGKELTEDRMANAYDRAKALRQDG